MYLSHFNFTTQPFRAITRVTGEFFVPYHQDVFGLLKEKSKDAGITALFSEDATLLSRFIDALKACKLPLLALDAFPETGGSTLLYKLNPQAGAELSRMQAIDATLRQWQKAGNAKVVAIANAQALKESGAALLARLLTRARELNFSLTILLTGSPDAAVTAHPLLRESIHTRHTLRRLTRRETLAYIQAQCEAHGAPASPLTIARVRRMHALTQGHISKLNALAHLSLLAAWTERAAQVSSRHLRLAAGELLPARGHKGLATAGLLASALFAACGWYFSDAINARLPIHLPEPASWSQQAVKPASPVVAQIDNDVVNQPDAMHQLYLMWGYDASADEALCQNAARVNLACKQGKAPLETLAREGYPWISEINTGNHINYAVVARVGEDSLDLLLNNRTWQVSRRWFNQHATGNFTLLHRLTPDGKAAISAASSQNDIDWFDGQLSQALGEPETHARTWSAEMMQRTRAFQEKMHLEVDGIPGEETLMQLMRANNATPQLLLQTSGRQAEQTTKEKQS